MTSGTQPIEDVLFCSSWSRKKAEIQEGMKKLPAEVAQGSAAEMPEEATPSDDEDTAAAAAAISAHSAAGEKHTVAIEAQDATETKPLLVSEQDPAPPVQGESCCNVRC